MKMRYLIILLVVISRLSHSQVSAGNWSVNPDPFFETQEITITVSDLNSGNLSGIENIYLWTWYSKSGGGSTNDDSQWNGQWDSSNESMKMSQKSDGSFTFTFNPSEFFNDSSIETIGVLAKAKDGSGDKKTQDYIFEVGVFDLTIINPQESISIIEKGGSLEVDATTSVSANFLLRSGETILHQLPNSTPQSTEL